VFFAASVYNLLIMSVILILLILLLLLWFWLIGSHSGVTREDRKKLFAGDDVIPRPSAAIDRATTFNVPSSVVWPWLVQLGKGRAGWYAPVWLERLFPAKRRGAHEIIPMLQKVRVGEIHPDWGPGALQVLEIKKNKHIIYGSVKGKDAPARLSFYLFSWSLILLPIGDTKCRLYIRLRARRSKHPILMRIGFIFGGLFDYLTIIALFAGLRQRLYSE
jgi:hypothetical protein